MPPTPPDQPADTPSDRSPATAPWRFVAIGECMVELAPSGPADHYRLGFAGDAFNTAWYVKSLCPDWRVAFASRVGEDAISRRLLARMEEGGIETRHVLRSAERSVGLYLITLRDGERSFSYWRDHSAARQLADDAQALDAAMAGADVVYFTGITLGVLEGEGRETLLESLRRARAKGATIVFDSNLRPRLWRSPAEMTRAVEEAAGVSDMVLPSFDDEALHFGDADPAATVARYLAAGPDSVIVKNGGGDVHYSHHGATGAVTPPPASAIVDTTAAGDSFNAALLAALARGEDIAGAIGAAGRVAVHVIAHKGALVPLPRSGTA